MQREDKGKAKGCKLGFENMLVLISLCYLPDFTFMVNSFPCCLKYAISFLCDLDRFAWFPGHAPTEGVLLRANVLMSHRRINQFKSVPTGRIGPVFESIVCCVNQLYVVQASCVLCRAVAYCANLHPRIVGIWFKSRFFYLMIIYFHYICTSDARRPCLRYFRGSRNRVGMSSRLNNDKQPKKKINNQKNEKEHEEKEVTG